jgi:photosystem II stability/assembly factor-like uncharacterized protein
MPAGMTALHTAIYRLSWPSKPKPMKTIFTSFAVLLFTASCRKEPATQPVIEPPPANTENTAGWQKSNPGLGGIVNFYFITPATGFSAGARGIHRTLDSGKTWMPVDANLKSGRDIFFYNQQQGYAVTLNDFGVTSDGGATWNFKALPFARDNLERVFFASLSTGFITTRHGLYKTTDGGATWSLINSIECGGVYFKNENEGWIGAKFDYASSLLKTTDGGLSFMQVPSTGGAQAYTIMFTDSLHGWANTGPSQPSLLRTADGGATWDRVPTNVPSIDLQFVNNTVGYTATGRSVIKSTDGGTSWNEILKVNEFTSIIEMFFIDENNGWAGDWDGNLYRWHRP